jgi:hypothetical protein
MSRANNHSIRGAAATIGSEGEITLRRGTRTATIGR